MRASGHCSKRKLTLGVDHFLRVIGTWKLGEETCLEEGLLAPAAGVSVGVQ